MRRIAIVGAGISGLSAAWYLQRAMPEARVEVFDAAQQLGGVIQTLDSESSEYLVECGADNFATLLPDAWQLVEQMGLTSEFITPRPEYRIAQVVCRGQLIPIPNGFSLMQPTRMGAILATPILSWRGKLRVLQEYFVPAKRTDDDESVESFAVRRLGRECFDRLVEPIVGGIFTARSETLSMQAAMPQFVAMEKQHGGLIRAAMAKRRGTSASDRSAREASGARYDQFVAPKRGMTWWLEQIAQPLGERLRLRTEVVSLAPQPGGGWQLGWRRASCGDTQMESFHAVILAVPSYRAAELVAPWLSEVAEGLRSIPYASSAIAVLAMRRSEIWPHAMCFGSIAPTIENRDCLAISLSSEKYAGRCPEDTVLARVFMGGAVRPEMLERSDEELIACARREVAALMGIRSEPSFSTLVRWNRAMPQYLVGHRQRLARWREAMQAFRGLELIGNAYDGVGIPQCVRGARQAAERISNALLNATGRAE